MEGNDGNSTQGFTFAGLSGNADNETQANVAKAPEADVSAPAADKAEDATLASIMTDGDGSAEPEAEPGKEAGEKDEGKDAADTAKEQVPAWISQLPSELQEDKNFAQFKKLGDLAKAWKDLSAKADKAGIPAEDASAEEINAFYGKLGKPEKASGYNLKGAQAEALGQLFFSNNLTTKQAESIAGALEKIGNDEVGRIAREMQKQAVDTNNALKAEYGSNYGEKMQLLKKGMDNYGGKDIRAKLQKAGLSFDPDIIHMFIQLGSLSQEATTGLRGTSSSGYKSNAEGGKFTFKDL